ncbi:Adenylate kinase/UMP-CMP kinase,Adenylate kinase, conserved site,Adenylate kinase, active site lid [Cinara cedri]|uniref:GTP:AMP phosphotransferase, mitochondrial n=1 Tax=Cinara cedri TaxID=506608 RepID=A0A5E4M388_9HEMI|nr:Adenylate kinase/UMP-CMP kinase,Adenylate kinase, conserved site,Adenylate kinase, active site lid [Cinara cedri]
MAVIKRLHALIMGAPGSGKGTVSERIVQSFNLLHVSSGDILRNMIREKTDLGVQVNKFVSNGQLVPDELMLKIIGDELNRLSSSNNNWLLDGFPRTKSQALSLFKIAPVQVVISLDVPFDVIIDRVKGRWIHAPSGRVYNTDFNAPKVPGRDDVTGELLVQREDDKPESVKKRLEIYSQMAGPILEYYAEQNVLAKFSGKTTNEIWPQVYKYLATKIEPKEKIV